MPRQKLIGKMRNILQSQYWIWLKLQKLLNNAVMNSAQNRYLIEATELAGSDNLLVEMLTRILYIKINYRQRAKFCW